MAKALLVLYMLSSLARLSLCSLPKDLSSHVNEYICTTDVRLVIPRTVADVKEAVKRHARVKATGTGCTFNKIFCAPSPSTTEDPFDTSANIVMTTIRPLKIQVDEKDRSVWVSAGATIWDLVLYLTNYVTPVAPRGYTVMGPPIYINQTVAGAIATATHGSTLKHGSFSNQVLAVKAILANGTLAEISQERHPFLIKAFRVNVGRLGVVTEVKLRIVPETLAQRILNPAVPTDTFLHMLRQAQEMYKATGFLPEWLDGTTVFWLTTNSTFELYTARLPDEPNNDMRSECLHGHCYGPSEDTLAFLEELARTHLNAPLNLSCPTGLIDVAGGVEWEEPLPFPPDLDVAVPEMTSVRDELSATNLRTNWNNATVETHKAFFFSTAAGASFLRRQLVDDYSLSIPANKMADCFERIVYMVENTMPDNGIRWTQYLRFVGKDDALLSSSNTHPQLRFDLIDALYYNQENRTSNLPLKEILAFITSSPLCSPVRLHWGKAGWPDPGCWNGAEIYKETWCDFGCAVLELDPYDKFVGGESAIWNWNGANLETCCTPDGYDASLEGCGCDVIPVRTPDECPEAPFFTYR